MLASGADGGIFSLELPPNHSLISRIVVHYGEWPIGAVGPRCGECGFLGSLCQIAHAEASMPFRRVVTASALDEAVQVADVAAGIGLAGRAKICLPLFLIADMARPPLTAIARTSTASKRTP
jgi:hypothetical protein